MLAAARSKIPWALVAVEVVAIFLSVFLAFGVTEWRQGRREAEQRRQALEAYRSEVASNQQEVAAKLPYHEALLDSIQTLYDGPPPASMDALFAQIGWNGPRQAFFTASAQNTAEATGAIGLIDYALAERLTRIYTLQRQQEVTQRNFAAAAFDPALFAEASTASLIGIVASYLQMVVESERLLLEQYDAALPRLDAALAPRQIQPRRR